MEGITSPSMAQVSTDSSVFTPLLISMLGVVVTTMAIMAYHLILVKYCVRRHAAAAAEQSVSEPGSPIGVNDKVLQTIPILVFSAVRRRIGHEECVVCLGELEDGDAVRLLPNCNHAFHVSCIDQWFAAHVNCPVCRSPLQPQQQQQTVDPPPASPDTDAAEDLNRGENCATQPVRSLRRCASLQAAEERESRSRLKRSLSMDQSQAVVVAIDLHGGNCASTTSFDSASRGILRSGSLSHFEHVASNKWLRSFSWLRTWKPSHAVILPH